MNVLFSHPTGNQNSRAVLEGLASAGLLNEFHTTISSFPGSFWEQLSRFSFLKEIERRSYLPSVKGITQSHPALELVRLFAEKTSLPWLTKHETGLFSVDAVYRRLDKIVAKRLKKNKEIDSVYAYEDGAYYSFREAKQKGITCLYDLPIGYWRSARKLLSEELVTRPDWASTLTAFKDSSHKLLRKDEELRLADHIFVASSFTASTLAEYPGQLAPVSVIPYGFSKPYLERKYDSLSDRPLRLLFVGGLSQRKGIADVFESVENIGDAVTLTVVGRKPTEYCEALNGAVKKHKWIESLPHDQILRIMHQHDILLFPSLFEGFGLVITEAMSQGTPVITTEMTAGPDLIENGKNGWIIKGGKAGELENILRKLLSNTDDVVNAGRAALQTALQRPWSVYSQEVAAAILKLKKMK